MSNTPQMHSRIRLVEYTQEQVSERVSSVKPKDQISFKFEITIPDKEKNLININSTSYIDTKIEIVTPFALEVNDENIIVHEKELKGEQIYVIADEDPELFDNYLIPFTILSRLAHAYLNMPNVVSQISMKLDMAINEIIYERGRGKIKPWLTSAITLTKSQAKASFYEPRINQPLFDIILTDEQQITIEPTNCDASYGDGFSLQNKNLTYVSKLILFNTKENDIYKEVFSNSLAKLNKELMEYMKCYANYIMMNWEIRHKKWEEA